MDLELAGKAAIVTGGAGDLGEVMLARLLDEGASCVVVDCDEERVEATVERLSPRGDIVGHVADVSRPDFADGVVDRCRDAFGGLDAVVNAAAIYPSKTWDEYSAEEFDAVLATNLRSVFVLAKAAVPVIRSRGGGSIVNIGSITILIGREGLLPYVASKAGMVGLTRSLAREVGPDNVRVNVVSPGAFQTQAERIIPDLEAYNREIIAAQCLKRRARHEELADVVAFLVSERSSFVTGQMVEVDGGWAHW